MYFKDVEVKWWLDLTNLKKILCLLLSKMVKESIRGRGCDPLISTKNRDLRYLWAANNK